MKQPRIDRINELWRKSRAPGGLSDGEKAEQTQLRQEYVAAFKKSLTDQLDTVVVVDEQGNKTALKKKG